MGGGPVFNQSMDSMEISQEQNNPTDRNSLYPTYNPDDFQFHPVPLTAPQLPPVPEAYQTTRREDDMRMIYTKSGFYSNGAHGFFTIFSKSMEDIQVRIAWIPEEFIDPADITQFVELDGLVASDHEFPNFCYARGESTLLKDIYSFRMSRPTLERSGSIEVKLRSGLVLGAIVYASHQTRWPGYDIVDVLNNFVPIKSWVNDIYVVGESPEQLWEPTPPMRSPASPEEPVPDWTRQRDALIAPWLHTVRDAQWTVLENLSKITQYSRGTAGQVLDHPFAQMPLVAPHLQFLRQYTHRRLPRATESVQDAPFLNDPDLKRLLVDAPELQGPCPIHTRGESRLSKEVWEGMLDSEGRLSWPVPNVREMIFRHGLCDAIRPEVWLFLLGVVPWESTRDERKAILQSQRDAYYRIKATWFDHPAIQETEHFQTEKHKIDKDVHRTDRSQEAFETSEMPNPDPSMTVGTNANLETLKDILISYNFYNTDLGYVQGMSDLLAPLFVTMEDEAQAFWAFSNLMDRLQSNFYIDQSGMLAQLNLLKELIQFMDPELYKKFEQTESTHLFFCFRWLLVWFKREFEWEDVIALWEVLWTHWLTDKMVLFVALAVLETHRNTLIDDLDQFDDILKYINDLTGQLDLKETLAKAEVLYYQFERKARAMQRQRIQLQDKLKERRIWNSPERPQYIADIERLQLPKNLLAFLDHSKK